jgi:hypothetical protein
MSANLKPILKQVLGQVPFTAEAYWYLRQSNQPRVRGLNLRQLENSLPGWCAPAAETARHAQPGKRVLIFGVLRYWLSHAALLGTTLAGLGHRVTLAYLPYGRWQTAVNRFDLRRTELYARRVLQRARPLMEVVSWLDGDTAGSALPHAIESAAQEVALRDTQYTLQVEDVSRSSRLYHLRLARNTAIARAALAWLQTAHPPDYPEVMIVPNGTIFEFGVLYRLARYLQIPVVTYEFGEQRGRLWLALNAEVMRQQTDGLWAARGGRGISPQQLEQVRALFASRQRASLWENFARRWQGVPSTGGAQARAALGLDGRPLVLLATNVIGDSLTLGRQVFSDSMTEWLARTARFFADRPGVQLVVRIHPGELVTRGPSVADVVRQTLPEIPAQVHLVPADAPINTYDLVEIADLGLVYTTTVGLEMAMSGVPVIPVGQTHYRGKGFTLDPGSWEAYFQTLEQVLAAPERYRLSAEQVERAWEYAYRFFFEFPQPFPWHLVHMWEDLQEWPVGRVLSEAGREAFGRTFDYLVGEPLDWSIST